MAILSENQYDENVNRRAMTRPMMIPDRPQKEPMPTMIAANRVRRKVVLMVLRSIPPSWCVRRLKRRQQAGNSLLNVEVERDEERLHAGADAGLGARGLSAVDGGRVAAGGLRRL